MILPGMGKPSRRRLIEGRRTGPLSVTPRRRTPRRSSPEAGEDRQ